MSQRSLRSSLLVRFPLFDPIQHSYSITSSARASNFSGTSILSAFAVLRLITSSNFVGCRTVFLTYQDCAQLGLEARSRGRFSSNVNGTTVCVSHVSGITGARHVIEGNIEYGYSWIICGWTSNSGLNLTVACWAIAVEAKMNINPAARENCTDFVIVFLP